MRRLEIVRKLRPVSICIFMGVIWFGYCALAASDKWEQKDDAPEAISWHSGCVVNGKIYIVGGLSGWSTVKEYEPKTGNWLRKADMPTGRDSFYSCLVNGRIYAIGGEDAAAVALSTVEEYDPSADKWMKKTNMPTARRDFGASVVNGRIYVIGGTDGIVDIPKVEEYDPLTDTWTTKSDMLTPRSFLRASAVEGKIYAIGGDQGFNIVPTVEEYDPAKDKWEKKTDMPTARCNISTCVVNGKIYAIGGSRRVEGLFWKGASSAVEEYDPGRDDWTKKADMPTERFGFSASVVDGRIYAIGGMDDRWISLPTIEEYTPEDRSQNVSPAGKLKATWGEIKCWPFFR